MSVARKGVWTALVAGVSAVGLLAGADSALAETKTFIAQGCEKWEVPAGVSSVAIQATGAAGQTLETGAPGGKGDGFSAVLSGLSFGEDLFVCVDQGGGATGGSALLFPGGAGGGASGVSRGSGFESPVLVAAGGGGGGGAGIGELGVGGNAGEAGHDGELTGSGGGAGTESEAGAGGKGDTAAENGQSGAKFTNAGPGLGGAGGNSGTGGADGGGGGGGYYGGGGGGATGGGGGPAAGGGGGADFCANGATSCEKHTQAGTKHEAGEAEGDAKVTLTYMSLPTSKDQCKGGGWKNFGTTFKNQGQCVKFVEHHNHAARLRRSRRQR
jgi:hypothetical protein